MAAYKFAESIVTGMPVPLYEAGGGQQLKRDFTYIADIVSGVLSALDRTPVRCAESYNLGYGQPLVVEDMLEYLQKELDTQAIIVSHHTCHMGFFLCSCLRVCCAFRRDNLYHQVTCYLHLLILVLQKKC